MSEDKYAIQFDDATGRAFVSIHGDLSVRKIRNTFAAISLNPIWSRGDRSILWQAMNALIPDAFEFANIFQTTQLANTLTKPGKSAIVVEKNSEMLRKVARFYQGIALSSSIRKIEVFFSEEEALAWLDK